MKRKQQKCPVQTFRIYKRLVHTTSKKALAKNRYYRPLCYFQPGKTTTLIDKRPVGILHELSELQMTSSPQMPIKDVQLQVQMTTYWHTNNGWIH